MPSHYLIRLRPARDTFLADATPEESALVGQHFEHLKRLLDEGKLLLAGRTEDATLGIVILEEMSQQEAKAIMDDDPAINSGVFTAELHPYRLALMSGRTS